MNARGFLGIVGAAYLGLAVWCAAMPAETSNTVGFTLKHGAGQSEYLTVYGGLQVALGIAFLRPTWKPSETESSLWLCRCVHWCLAVFRSAGFLMFPGIAGTTFALAGTEWMILIGAIWYKREYQLRQAGQTPAANPEHARAATFS